MSELQTTAVSRDRSAVHRIEAQLGNETFPFAYSGETLEQFVEDLQSHLKVPVVIDRTALEEYGIGTDTPIKFKVEGIATRSALRLCLTELDLTYSIANEVILITTPEEAEAMLDTRVYDVAETRLTTEALLELITTTIRDSSWDAVGGPGKIAVATPETLVISQTQDVHERVVDLLAQLTRVARSR